MKQIRNSKYNRLLWGFLGLYFLNISVDTADLSPRHLPEDLSFNDQESVIEIIVEQVLGFQDAIKEYDDNDTEDHNTKTNLKIDWVVSSLHDYKINNRNHLFNKLRFSSLSVHFKNPFLEKDFPPPKF